MGFVVRCWTGTVEVDGQLSTAIDPGCAAFCFLSLACGPSGQRRRNKELRHLCY